MVCLLLLMLVLAVRSVTLPGAVEGLKFYLVPDFHDLAYDTDGRFILGAAIYDAMGQAFFTLSLGIGAMAIFGSYIGKGAVPHRRGHQHQCAGYLCGPLVAGLIIFPSCFAFGVNPGQGVGLIFVTLPNVFNQMPLGGVWGGLFFCSCPLRPCPR